MSKVQSMMWALGRHIVMRDQKGQVLTVIEYPKGGGTWVAKCLATSLNLPFVGSGKFLPLIPCVIRTHWRPDPKLAPGVLVVRDPRDVMVSLFHHRARNINRTPVRRKQFEELFGEVISPEKIQEQLSGFIELEFEDPRYGAHQNWSDYAKDAAAAVGNSGGRIKVVKYEDMVSTPVTTLQSVLSELGYEVPEGIVKLTNDLHDKKWGDKKYSSASDETTFIRTGKSGGWADVFDFAARRSLHNWCGEQMIELGYEDSDDWLNAGL